MSACLNDEDFNAIAYGIAKLFHTPLGQLRDEADAHRQMLVGAVPIRDQLAQLDRLVAAHETYWAAVAQHNPRSTPMRDFLRLQWDPWFTNWTEARSRLDHQKTVYDQGSPRSETVSASADAVAAFVHEAAQGLASIRDFAAYNGIPTPDLGTSRHGFIPAYPIPAIHFEEPRVAGLFAETNSAVSGDQGERQMSAYDYVGADGGSYPEIASKAVISVYHQNPSPVYGYLRAGTQQKIYLFNALEEAHGWLTALIHGQAQPYDYAAVFAATDLSRPVPGLESFGHTTVSGDAAVGNILPFLLGLPLGAAGGYFYRDWQEKHPGKWIPGISGDYGDYGVGHDYGGYSVGGPWVDLVGPQVGGPWLDMVGPQVGGPWVDMVGPQVGGPWVDLVGQDPGYSVGGPWVDLVGAQTEDYTRKRTWPQTRALIDSAKHEVADYNTSYPTAAWVWSLDPPGPSSRPGVQLTGFTTVMPFSSLNQAIDYMRSRIHTDHVALALFDTASPHWPNPVGWTKSDDPVYEPVIAQHVAKSAPPARTAGDYGGGYSRQTTIGTAIDDVRIRAQSLANKRAGSVIGVIHTVKDGLWHALSFRNEDDADDWLGTATQDPASYTYAAYYDKDDVAWPHPVNEKIGGLRASKPPGQPIRRELATTSGEWWAA